MHFITLFLLILAAAFDRVVGHSYQSHLGYSDVNLRERSGVKFARSLIFLQYSVGIVSGETISHAASRFDYLSDFVMKKCHKVGVLLRGVLSINDMRCLGIHSHVPAELWIEFNRTRGFARIMCTS